MRLLPLLFLAIVAVNAYYTLSVYAPSLPQIHSRIINARNKAFIIGATKPSTFCGLDNATECPDGTSTQVDGNMTGLAAAVPGGQFIFVAPDGIISYPPAHSALRPPGSQMGGFQRAHVISECKMPITILMWSPENASPGLWACPTARNVPVRKEAVLKATTSTFTGSGCLTVEGIEIQTAGDKFAAWAYTCPDSTSDWVVSRRTLTVFGKKLRSVVGDIFHVCYLVNDGILESSMIGKLKQSYPSEPIEHLRARYEKDGYLFMKGLLPRSDVLGCREAYFRFLSPSGVLQPNSAPVDGIFDPDNKDFNYPSIGAGPFGKEQINPGSFASLVEKAHTEDFYLEFSRHPALRDFVSALKGWGDNTKLLPRSLLRNNTPHNNAIGAREGGMSEEERIDAFNKNMMSNGFLELGPIKFLQDNGGGRWLLTEYEAGDVVFHKPHMIHASTINKDPENRIRLGTDLRFVDSSRPHDTRWSAPFRLDDGL
ncbi:phytanoyl hydroxylase [Fusarium globosum]|uniref:Phytanoyl hydroxylase n=1 Tax=Fusarium globosum TaxID=78864 RepID=A0A8H6D1T9_9HYPO|nr:phytanoyl hydroxylase [Fusarium globosum]